MAEEGRNGWDGVVSMGQSVSHAISTLSTTVIGLQTTMVEVRSDVGDVKTDIRARKAGVNVLKGDVQMLAVELKGVRSDLLSTRTDLMSRMDRFRDRPSSATDDLTVNYSPSVKSERLARNSLEEVSDLSDEVNAMQFQIRRLSVKVFGPDETH